MSPYAVLMLTYLSGDLPICANMSLTGCLKSQKCLFSIQSGDKCQSEVVVAGP